jgi:hypothetical protein
LQAQWTKNASLSNAPVAVFVRASDNHLILKSWHAQLGVHGAGTITQQQIINGVPQTSGAMSIDAFEWQFPAGEDVSTSHSISGSNTIATNGAVGPMQPGGSQGTASCTWQYTLGGSVPTGQNGSNPGNTNTGNPGSTNTGNPGNTNNGSPGNTNTGGQPQPPAPSFTISGPIGVDTEWKTDVPQHLTGQNTHWVNGVSAADMGGAGVTAKMVVTDATHAEVSVTVDPGDPSFREGQRTMTVRTGSEVISAPSLSVSDTLYWGGVWTGQAQQGSQNVSMTVMGGLAKLAVTGQPVTVDFGPGITVVGPVTITDGSKAPVTLNIDATAAVGPRDVTIRSGTLSLTGSKAFTVTAASTPPAGGGSTPPGGTKTPVGKTPIGKGPTPVTAQPTIALSPNSAAIGSQAFAVTITGTNTHFDQAATVLSFNPPIGWGKTVNSPTSMVAPLTITDNTPAGPVDVTVKTGTEVITLPHGFTVTPAAAVGPPAITLSPNSATRGSQLFPVTITGANTHFQQATTILSFGPNVAWGKTVNSPTSMVAPLTISSSAPVGPVDVIVKTGAETITVPQGFTITSGAPVVPPNAPTISISPATGMQGTDKLTVNVTGTNTHFAEGATLPYFGPGVGVSQIVSSPTSMIVYLRIPSDADVGPVNVEVKSGPEVVTLPHGFTITQGLTVTPIGAIPVQLVPPTITSVDPASTRINVGSGGYILSVTVNGKGTHFRQGVTKADFGPGTTVNGVSVDSPEKLSASVQIALPGAASTNTVTVTTGSEVAKLENGFTLVDPSAGPAPPPSGKYRIMINGFHVNHETFDDIFNADGQHDEVYASASLELVDHNLNRLQPGPVYVRTAVHGDINQAPNRVQAGSAVSLTGSRTGGLTNGDSVPNGSNPATYTGTRSYPTDPKPTFPFVLWEGTMTNGTEALVVQPMLWEFDGNQTGYSQWSNPNNQGFAGQDYYRPFLTQKINGADLTPFDGGVVGVYCVTVIYIDPTANCQPGYDRPIGVPDNGFPRSSVMVFTREAIEKALSSTYSTAGMPPGVIRLSFVEAASNWGGNYDLYIKVERIP